MSGKADKRVPRRRRVPRQALDELETQGPGGQTFGRAPETSLGEVGPGRVQAALALARLRELSVDMRGGAFFAPSGELMASTGDDTVWAEFGTALVLAAEAADPREFSQLHVGGEAGEVFLVRYEGYAIIVTAERYTLASLFASDLRATLHDLVEGHAGLDRRAPDPATGTHPVVG